MCNGCFQSPIVGVRYKCSVCKNFDFCSSCEEKRSHDHAFLKINKPIVYHRGVECDGCGQAPIAGDRYKCSVCDNFDFCSTCEEKVKHDHSFLKIKKPEQAPDYNGNQHQGTYGFDPKACMQKMKAMMGQRTCGKDPNACMEQMKAMMGGKDPNACMEKMKAMMGGKDPNTCMQQMQAMMGQRTGGNDPNTCMQLMQTMMGVYQQWCQKTEEQK